MSISLILAWLIKVVNLFVKFLLNNELSLLKRFWFRLKLVSFISPYKLPLFMSSRWLLFRFNISNSAKFSNTFFSIYSIRLSFRLSSFSFRIDFVNLKVMLSILLKLKFIVSKLSKNCLCPFEFKDKLLTMLSTCFNKFFFKFKVFKRCMPLKVNWIAI